MVASWETNAKNQVSTEPCTKHPDQTTGGHPEHFAAPQSSKAKQVGRSLVTLGIRPTTGLHLLSLTPQKPLSFPHLQTVNGVTLHLAKEKGSNLRAEMCNS